MSYVKINLETLEKVLGQSDPLVALADLVTRYRELERAERALRLCAHAKGYHDKHCPVRTCPNYYGNFPPEEKP